MSSRALANNVETSCLLIATWLFESAPLTAAMCGKKSAHLSRCLIGAALVVSFSLYVRPTAAVLLGPLWLYYFILSTRKVFFLVLSMVVAFVTFVVCVMIDQSAFWLQDNQLTVSQLLPSYGGNHLHHLLTHLTELFYSASVYAHLPPVNFLYYNVYRGFASSFGVKPAWWYVIEVSVVLLLLYELSLAY